MLPCARSEPQPVAVPFLGFEFNPLELSDGPVLAPVLERHPHSLSGYTFGSLFAWSAAYDYRWAQAGSGAVLVSFDTTGSGQRHLLQPIGPLDATASARLLDAARRLPYPLRIHGADQAFLDANPALAPHFKVRADRDCANYIYRASEIASLAGRRYARKRNLLAQAARAFRWTVEPLAPANVSAALEVVREAAREASGTTESLTRDSEALVRALALLGPLRQAGLLVGVEGKPVGLSVFEARPDTLEIHFERTLRRFKGLHQVVNQLGAQAAVARGLEFVNREEDMGNPGLRQAKESCCPVRLADSYELTLE